MVIPGYQGFVPGMKNGTLMHKRYTECAREALTVDNIDNKDNKLASTG